MLIKSGCSAMSLTSTSLLLREIRSAILVNTALSDLLKLPMPISASMPRITCNILANLWIFLKVLILKLSITSYVLDTLLAGFEYLKRIAIIAILGIETLSQESIFQFIQTLGLCLLLTTTVRIYLQMVQFISLIRVVIIRL